MNSSSSSQSPSPSPLFAGEAIVRVVTVLRIPVHASNPYHAHRQAEALAGEIRHNLEGLDGNYDLIDAQTEAELERFAGPPSIRVEQSRTREARQQESDERDWCVSFEPPPGFFFVEPSEVVATQVAMAIADVVVVRRTWGGHRLAVVEIGCDRGGMDALQRQLETMLVTGGIVIALGEEVVDRRCRRCGCTDLNACAGGCHWVGDSLCSQCGSEAA